MNSSKKSTKSPLEGRTVSRQPGQSLVKELYLDKAGRYALAIGFGMGGFTAALLCAGFAFFNAAHFWFVSIFLMVMFGGFGLWEHLKFYRQLPALKLGIEGERNVADELRALERRGFEIVHDMPSRRGDSNIDHIVIGPTGVFVIETKTRSKTKKSRVEYDGKKLRVNGFDCTEEIEAQVGACRKEVRDQIRDLVGHEISVRGIVVYPGWWVENPTPEKHTLWVLNPKGLESFITREDLILKDPALISSIATQLRRESSRLHELSLARDSD